MTVRNMCMMFWTEIPSNLGLAGAMILKPSVRELELRSSMYALMYGCECIMRNNFRVIFINGTSRTRVLLMKMTRKLYHIARDTIR